MNRPLPNWTRGSAAMVRDAVLVAGIAVITYQALCRWCGDRYWVPTGSMEPVLHGDPDHGDIVFVDKLARRSDCDRHDIVVVEHPKQPGEQLVKRIAANGDDAERCFVDIRDGDVWLGPDAQRMARDAKDPLAARPMRVLWAEWPRPAAMVATHLDLRAARLLEGELALDPAGPDAASLRTAFRADARRHRRKQAEGGTAPTGFLGTARAVDATYIDARGERGREGDDVQVLDCGLELRTVGAAAPLLAVLETRSESFVFHWQPAAGRLELWSHGENVAATDLPVVGPGERRIEFGRLDGRLFFAVDGRRDAMWCVPLQKDWQVADENVLPMGPRTHLALAAVGGEALRVVSLRVFRDVFAWRERIAGMPGQPGEWPRFVPPGHWFLLGDNAFDSRDSRHFDAVPNSLFRGRPRCVLGPWPRGRWLP